MDYVIALRTIAADAPEIYPEGLMHATDFNSRERIAETWTRPDVIIPSEEEMRAAWERCRAMRATDSRQAEIERAARIGAAWKSGQPVSVADARWANGWLLEQVIPERVSQ